MLASDDANPQFVGARNPDSVLNVEFYNRPVQNNIASQEAGRPIFEDLVYVKIEIPGNQLSKIDRPMYEGDKERFPFQWMQFQANVKGLGQEGTPIAHWPRLTAGQAQELVHAKFTTIDSVANASDAQLMSLGQTGVAGMHPFALREAAKAYLANAQDTALPQKLAADNEALREEIRLQNEQHAREMAEMRALIEKATAPRKPGPKKKETVDEPA